MPRHGTGREAWCPPGAKTLGLGPSSARSWRAGITRTVRPSNWTSWRTDSMRSLSAKATQALGDVTGTASIERWNDDAGRTLAEVIATIDRAVELLEGY